MVIKKDSKHVKFRLFRNPVSSTSETHESKLVLSKNGEPEEIPIFIWYLNNTHKETGVNDKSGNVQYMHTLLCKEDLREFYFLGILIVIITNNH